MRTFCLAALALSSFSMLIGGTPAAPRPETTTYVDGNLTGVTPNTGGTLVFSSDKAMQFRSGLATVDVPYSNIVKAELGARQTHSHNAPVYKVWALPKRIGAKTQTQLLLLEFKGDDGEAKSMTLELASSSVNNVVSTINSHRSPSEGPVTTTSAALAPPSKATKASKADRKKATETASVSPAAAPKPAWWGDGYWKTGRNADRWETAAAGSAKPATTDKPSPTQQ